MGRPSDTLRATLDRLALDPTVTSERKYLVSVLRRLGYSAEEIDQELELYARQHAHDSPARGTRPAPRTVEVEYTGPAGEAPVLPRPVDEPIPQSEPTIREESSDSQWLPTHTDEPDDDNDEDQLAADEPGSEAHEETGHEAADDAGQRAGAMQWHAPDSPWGNPDAEIGVEEELQEFSPVDEEVLEFKAVGPDDWEWGGQEESTGEAGEAGEGWDAFPDEPGADWGDFEASEEWGSQSQGDDRDGPVKKGGRAGLKWIPIEEDEAATPTVDEDAPWEPVNDDARTDAGHLGGDQPWDAVEADAGWDEVAEVADAPEDPDAFDHGDYRLYTREVERSTGDKHRIFFFSRGEPKNAEACRLPDGYEVRENSRTGVPYLKRVE